MYQCAAALGNGGSACHPDQGGVEMGRTKAVEPPAVEKLCAQLGLYHFPGAQDKKKE